MMHNPPHPGEFLKDNFGPDGLNLTLVEAARRLGISRVTLSRVVNGKAAISADLAIRLERANLSTARMWLDMQTQHDLYQAMSRRLPKVLPLQPKQKLAAERDFSITRRSTPHCATVE